MGPRLSSPLAQKVERIQSRHNKVSSLKSLTIVPERKINFLLNRDTGIYTSSQENSVLLSAARRDLEEANTMEA